MNGSFSIIQLDAQFHGPLLLHGLQPPVGQEGLPAALEGITLGMVPPVHFQVFLFDPVQ